MDRPRRRRAALLGGVRPRPRRSSSGLHPDARATSTLPGLCRDAEPELRARFTARPGVRRDLFEFIAQEVREILASLGFRSLDEAIGHAELLTTAPSRTGRPRASTSRPWFAAGDFGAEVPRRNLTSQDHELDEHFDRQLIPLAQAALETGEPVSVRLPIRNTERAVGTMLGHEVTLRHGVNGLPTGTIDITLAGTAGQSLGAFIPAGIRLRLEGDANDYVGRPSGGEIIVRPDRSSVFSRSATDRRQCHRLRRDERDDVPARPRRRAVPRATRGDAVVEGVGDHALEYMTGGLAVIRQHGPQPGRRDVRRRRLRLRPQARAREPGRAAHGRLELTPLTGSTPRSSATCCAGTGRDRPGVAARMLDDLDAALARFVKVLRATTRRSCARARPRSTRGWTPTATSSGAGSWRSLVADPKGFKTRERELPARRPVPLRLMDWREVYERWTRAAPPGGRCMDCGVRSATRPPARQPHPGVERPHVAREGRAAIERLHATNNFPEFTGSLPRPCEDARVLGINQPAVTIKKVEETIIDQAWSGGWVVPHPPERLTGKTVAVVGSARRASPPPSSSPGRTTRSPPRARRRIGGLLRYGIPDFKMEKHHLDQRPPRCRPRAPLPRGCRDRRRPVLGRPARQVRRRAHRDRGDRPRDLPIPGRDLLGVHFAMDYLVQSNRAVAGDRCRADHAEGRHVVVIGGGTRARTVSDGAPPGRSR